MSTGSGLTAPGAKINPRRKILHPEAEEGTSKMLRICTAFIDFFYGERKGSQRYFTALLGGKSLFFGRGMQQESPAEFKDEVAAP